MNTIIYSFILTYCHSERRFFAFEKSEPRNLILFKETAGLDRMRFLDSIPHIKYDVRASEMTT
jgi:hypothetical protein